MDFRCSTCGTAIANLLIMKSAIIYVGLLLVGIGGFRALDTTGPAGGASLITDTGRLDEHGQPAADLRVDAVAYWEGPGALTAPDLTGIKPVASTFDRQQQLVTKRTPTKVAGGPIGAFRFLCQPGQLNWDDPIVYPGQPNASPHLHQWFGNTSANALSNYRSLRSEGESTCMGPLNRSAYWMPAMIVGESTVARPDYLVVYYKRYPDTADECRQTARDCLPLPHGLRYIFGYDMGRMGKTQAETTRRIHWKCVTPDNKTLGKTTRHFEGLVCPPQHLLIVTLSAPDCWDGRNLDAPDHRSHMAYQFYDGRSAQARCPASHPYLLPRFTLGASWRMRAGDDISKWRLASDRMPGMQPMPAGATFHSDWFGAWDPVTLQTWTSHCIDRRLSCVDGDLGDGTGLRRPAGYSSTASPRMVTLPPRPRPGPATHAIHAAQER